MQYYLFSSLVCKRLRGYVFRHGQETKAYWLFNDLRLGGSKHLDGIYYVDGQACYLSGSKIKDKEGKPELQILVSYCNAEEALDMYKLRWQVETMFRGLKHMRRAVSLFKYGLDYIFQCLVNHTNRYRINVFKFLSYT